MAVKTTIFRSVIFGILISLAIAAPACGEDISPAQNQEFLDAREALEAARKAQAEKYSSATVMKSADFLMEAEAARSSKDVVRFTQAARLARAYAELAEALTELKKEQDRLATANDEIKSIKAEIEKLNKN